MEKSRTLSVKPDKRAESSAQFSTFKQAQRAREADAEQAESGLG